MGTVTECGLCGSQSLRTLLDMGIQPLAERFDDDTAYPLLLLECGECSLVQLGYQVDQRILFPPDHPYSTGRTAVLVAHYGRMARELARSPEPGRVTPGLRPGELVVEIGAGDGTLLEQFSPDLQRIAVEPTNQITKCDLGVIRCQKFFSPRVAQDIIREHGRARLVLANNVMAHVPYPHEAADSIAALLADDGVFVSENHDVSQVLEGQWDAAYHEHFRCWSPATFARLLAAHGLEVSEIRQVPTHGGSFRTYARKRVSRLDEAPENARKLRELLAWATGAGHAVYGVGATTRAVPLIHYAGIARYISMVVEVAGSEKIGGDMPGTTIPVVDEKRLTEDQPAYALLLAWHLADFLIPKLRNLGYKGKFILPLPEPKVIG